MLINLIIMPVLAGLLVLMVPVRFRWITGLLALAAVSANLLQAILLSGSNIYYSIPWAGFGLDFALRAYNFSNFIVLGTSVFGFLIVLYCIPFMMRKDSSKQFYMYLLLSIAFVNGAVLADNLVLLLFFWEGLLLTLFGMISIGSKKAYDTAIKAFIIVGVSDLFMMVGIALCGWLAGTLTISAINIPVQGLGGLAFLFLMIGAISKAGSMPFHSWIPDAATDAPLPFMAFFPASIEKLIGIYFLTRITLDMFRFGADSWISMLLMIIGSLTILFAVAMALIQKDYKKLLSYHAISQVGYMILGIGTLVPAGIIGGLFHMINNALYKSCLFLTAGSVEKQAGSTNLEKLGGLAGKMPITFTCFFIAAVSISGVPPFNGFFSKELIYDGALERGMIFYLAAILGSFLTAASFLKLGHAAYLGKIKEVSKHSKEAPAAMLLPMIILAVICVVFGVFNFIPIRMFIQPSIASSILKGHDYAGFPGNTILVIITGIVLAAALLNHIYGVKKTGSGLKAVDHIHYAPVLSTIYKKAEKGDLDPYNWGLNFTKIISGGLWLFDRGVDWIYDSLIVKTAYAVTGSVRRAHSGNNSFYLLWSLIGTFIVFLILFNII